MLIYAKLANLEKIKINLKYEYRNLLEIFY